MVQVAPGAAAVELVIRVPREDVDVVVPDVLVAGELVVLPGGGALARIREPQGGGGFADRPVDSRANLVGEHVEVLVLDRDNEPGLFGQKRGLTK